MTRDQIIAANPLARYLINRGYDLRQSGKNVVTHACPVTQHKKYHRPNTIDPERNLWHCNDCDRGGTVIDWVMIEKNVSIADAMRMLGDERNSSEPLINERRNKPPRRLIAETYDYTDESGKLLFQCVRYLPKHFSQRQPDGNGGWIWNLEGVRRVLYRLPELLRGLERGLPVIIPEGEKDVDSIVKLGISAAVTCNPLGAKKWREECSETLLGANVFVIADKDKDGREHAQKVAASLHGKATRVKVLELPDRDGCQVKDTSDWLAAGGTVDELQDLLNNAPDWTPTAPPRSESQSTEITRPQPFPCIVFRRSVKRWRAPSAKRCGSWNHFRAAARSAF